MPSSGSFQTSSGETRKCGFLVLCIKNCCLAFARMRHFNGSNKCLAALESSSQTSRLIEGQRKYVAFAKAGEFQRLHSIV